MAVVVSFIFPRFTEFPDEEGTEIESALAGGISAHVACFTGFPDEEGTETAVRFEIFDFLLWLHKDSPMRRGLK
jgi:hypothetical protein